MELFLLELEWIIFIIKIILALVCGFVIGIERETMGKPAGGKNTFFNLFGIMSLYSFFVYGDSW